jgi:hypothetical protein
MNSKNDLIQKLMVSKAIMDKHKQMPRSGANGIMTEEYTEPRKINAPELESFNPVTANYNLPDEFKLTESKPITYQQPTEERIINSKLPDEIKRLMIEHPINQPNTMAGPSLSNDIVEKAARLMNKDAGGNEINKPSQRQIVRESVLDNQNLRSMLKEVLTEILTENGVIAESTTKSNETFSFKVGKHLFEGKVLKVKKLS